MSGGTVPISIVIPTYRRGSSLLRTLGEISAGSSPDEIIIVDQTEQHPAQIEKELLVLCQRLRAKRIMQASPSIPVAMNRGLLESRNDVVLFLDDDATPGENLLESHLRAHGGRGVGSVAGRVIQPEGARSRARRMELLEDLDFDFSSAVPARVMNVMAGNLSVNRSAALRAGGFDENFVGVAYRFETDFARRLAASGYEIVYEPDALIHHRKESSGGTRTFGDHRRSLSPVHSVGDFYFALRHLERPLFARYVLLRLRRNVLTRYHLRHPWWIPTKMIGEMRGLILALRLYRRGPKLLSKSHSGS
ncbi:MAG: glycosyltransferase [Acidobacteria bacterium]|nr:glycosyltransferase [Acidobacteriota bacterium]